MAMTKAEQARVALLETNLAFRWPTEAEPEPQETPHVSGTDTVGWVFNAHSASVERRWSGRVVNGGFLEDGKRSTHGSQGSVRLYLTKRDALLALRWATCRKMAAQLRVIDLKIEEA